MEFLGFAGIAIFLGGLVALAIIVLTLLAINNLHRLPKIQASIENIEEYSKYIAQYIKKQNTSNKIESPENKDLPVEVASEVNTNAG